MVGGVVWGYQHVDHFAGPDFRNDGLEQPGVASFVSSADERLERKQRLLDSFLQDMLSLVVSGIMRRETSRQPRFGA